MAEAWVVVRPAHDGFAEEIRVQPDRHVVASVRVFGALAEDVHPANSPWGLTVDPYLGTTGTLLDRPVFATVRRTPVVAGGADLYRMASIRRVMATKELLYAA
jgi:hypothetical protein